MGAVACDQTVTVEDLLRAVMRRDILFFYVAIDTAIDNLLQLLYAMNEVLFLSRKRVEQITGAFKLAPPSLYKRLCEIIRFGAEADTLHMAYERYSLLRDEIKELYISKCTCQILHYDLVLPSD